MVPGGGVEPPRPEGRRILSRSGGSAKLLKSDNRRRHSRLRQSAELAIQHKWFEVNSSHAFLNRVLSDFPGVPTLYAWPDRNAELGSRWRAHWHQCH